MDTMIPARNKPEPLGVRPCHILVVPYPGRGHVNPMMNLCKIISSRMDQIDRAHQLTFTFVVTQEWLSFIGTDPKPDTIRFATIPDVLPSEQSRATNMVSFIEAIHTKMEKPVEDLLDHVEIEKPVTMIVADSLLKWAVDVGDRRRIPVALLWTMSTLAFSLFYHFDLLLQNGHFPCPLERREEIVNYIPGISSICMGDLPMFLHEQNLYKNLQIFQNIHKAKYLLLSTIFELELQIINALNPKFPFPLCCIGPLIPFFNLEKSALNKIQQQEDNYLKWLDSQPANSILYVSMGSFLPISSAQIEEIIVGLNNSGVRFLWVARGETSKLKEIAGPTGKVLPWCDQLGVLCHPAIGGFWTHCGWNSTMESIFAGVPMLTFPICVDQLPNSKLIVDDWKVGWRVKRKIESLRTRTEIATLVNRFMRLDSEERKEMMVRIKVLQSISRRALEEGSSSVNLNMFLDSIR